MIGFKVLTERPENIERYVFNIIKLIIVSMISFELTNINIDLLDIKESIGKLKLITVLLALSIGIIIWFLIWEIIASSVFSILVYLTYHPIKLIFECIRKKKYTLDSDDRLVRNFNLLSFLVFIDDKLDFGVSDMLDDLEEKNHNLTFVEQRYNQYFFTLMLIFIFLIVYDTSINYVIWYKVVLIYGAAQLIVPGLFLRYVLKLIKSNDFHKMLRFMNQKVMINKLKKTAKSSAFFKLYHFNEDDLEYSRAMKKKENSDLNYPENILVKVVGVKDFVVGNELIMDVLNDDLNRTPAFLIFVTNVELSEETKHNIKDFNGAIILAKNNFQILTGFEELHILFDKKSTLSPRAIHDIVPLY